ncbi:MAG: DUF4116 domain-containing protein [Rhodospirillales bacterium]|jgi:hypothetical protein
MANIASGYVSIESTDQEFLDDLKSKINDGPFTYGGPADIMGNEYILEVDFTGAWSCEGAWVFLEDLMVNADYAFQQALIDSEMSGRESEEGAREAKEVSKQSGESLITRRDVSDEREWEDEEDEEEIDWTDKEVVIAAVKSSELPDGDTLQYASDELQEDPEILALI